MTGHEISFRPPAALLKNLRHLALACGLIFLVGLIQDPRRSWGGYLLGFQFFTGLSLSGGVFLAIFYVTRSSWGTVLRRIPEAMVGTLPFAFGLGLILILGIPTLYSWSHPAVVEASELLAHKSVWLNTPFFAIRMVVYFALWIWCAGRLVGESRAQDADGDRIHTSRNLKNSVLYMAVFAVTFSLASMDWIQSLEPEWFSTMFALVTSSGIMCSGLALVMLAAVLMRWSHRAQGTVTRNHLDDLGKLAMGFCLFWVYIWFCQYMLIWYTDMPEETSYFALRQGGNWGILAPVNLILNFAVPFLVLMPKRFRRRGSVLLRVAIIMLVGRALDLYLLIEPPLSPESFQLGIWELAPLVGCLALFSHVFLRKLGEAPLVPTRDPWLEQSLSYHC